MKRLSSVVFCSIFIFGCARPSDSTLALKKWDDKYQECFLNVNEKQIFPQSDWFDSLTLEERKSVIGYLYNTNSRNCIESEAEELRRALLSEGNESLLHIFESDLSPLESAVFDAVKHLDKTKLNELQRNFSKPFNLSKIVEQLKLYKQKI